MNTFGLGRQVNTFGLGLPYGALPDDTIDAPRGGVMITMTPDTRKKCVDYNEQNQMILDIVERLLSGRIL